MLLSSRSLTCVGELRCDSWLEALWLYEMADPSEDENYDLKDEELVDFEGSDYGFESAEEEAEEATAVAPPAPVAAHPAPAPAPASASAPESGEIEHVEDGRGDAGAVVKLPEVPPRRVVDDDVEVPLKAPKLPPPPTKPDLEDGELDDAAMVIILFSPPPCLHAPTPSLSPSRRLSWFSVLLCARVSLVGSLSVPVPLWSRVSHVLPLPNSPSLTLDDSSYSASDPLPSWCIANFLSKRWREKPP